MLAHIVRFGPVSFDIELERIKVDNDEQKDLLVHVVCHRNGLDPHWSCSFGCKVKLCFESIGENGKAQGAKNAKYGDNDLVLPVMRLQSDPKDGGTLYITIVMRESKGVHARIRHDFSHKTSLTDATLIVEGRSIHVSRAILAIQSPYFHTLFYNPRFSDAAKTEFDLPELNYTDMLLFVRLVYPETLTGSRRTMIETADQLEAMLELSERFDVPSLKNLCEKFVMNSSGGYYIDILPSRRLLLADRYRLSNACSTLLGMLQRRKHYKELRETSDFDMMSESLRSFILEKAIDHLSSSSSPPPKRRTMDKSVDYSDDAFNQQPGPSWQIWTPSSIASSSTSAWNSQAPYLNFQFPP
ncbi:hypothetical protein PFISCL1PPCAC_19453 [Pristionchus fissidentatus]|uniref:BTB domain-containing protein n=1 Tax=Pristionchus fissidentatus TaxID=1538716 RepID=A0AAV5W7J1_9BILA|nr:hypothetical protein PFISCL1PPCAC_19453 [Pristionchus fissidentatus]